MINSVQNSCLILTVLFTALFISQPASSQEITPILKDGSCPSGYRTSGKYCVPGKNAGFAIKKIGSCPSGYRTSGNYCLAGNNAKPIIIKYGTCPSGFRTSGKYCVSNE